MKKKINILWGDTALWVIFFLLSVISLISVYSSIGRYVDSRVIHPTTPMAEFFRHLAFVLATYVIIVVFSHINYRFFAKVSKVAFYIALALTAIPLFTNSGRLLNLPLVKLSIQPSEFVKVALLVYLARMLAAGKDKLNDKNFLYKLIIPVALTCFLIFFENFSTSALIFLTCYITIYFGGMDHKLWWKGFGIIAVLGILLLIIFYFVGDQLTIARSTTWGNRLIAWMHPNYEDLNRQDNIARMAIARGGFFGKGIGTTIHGRLIGEAHNDFIFAIIIEEAGMLAALFIFALYAWFYFRCIRIANRCEGAFGSICVAAIGTVIFIQAILNMAVATGVMPVTGQTLPFISYGGSAYMSLGAGIGIIQAVATDNKRKARLAEKNAEETPTDVVEPTEQENIVEQSLV